MSKIKLFHHPYFLNPQRCIIYFMRKALWHM